MGLTSTVARRSLLQRPGRTIFSILGIAMGIATAVAGVTLDHSTVGGLISGYDERGTPDLEVRPSEEKNANGDVIDLTDIEGVELASAFFQNDCFVRPANGAEAIGARGIRQFQTRIRVFALQSDTFGQLGIHRLLAGNELDPEAREREVLIGEALAEELNLNLGDYLLMSRPRRIARKACVEGELATVGEPIPDVPPEVPFLVVGVLAREKLGRRSHGQVALIDYDWGTELYRGAHIAKRYWAKRDASVDLERLKSTLGRDYSYSMNKNVVIGQAADERAFRTGIRMAGLLALVLGLYVIFHTLSMSLAERVGEIGTLHALGTSKGQVARIFLAEAIFLAGAGAAAGLFGGIGLAYALSRIGITTLGSGKFVQAFLVPWPTALALAGAGFAIALAGSVYPLSRLGGANSVAALRGEDSLKAKGMARGFHLFSALLLAVILPGLYFVLVPVVGEYTAPLIGVLLAAVGLIAVLIVLPLVMPVIISGVCAALAKPLTLLWPLSGRLASRTMRAGATRIAVSCSAIALVTTGLVGLKGMTHSLRGEIEVWADEAVVRKLWLRDMDNVNYDDLRAHLSGYPEILGIEKGSVRTYVDFLMLGVDVDQLGNYGPCLEDPELIRKMRDEHGIIMSRRLARDLDYEVGDVKQVAKADGTLQAFVVIAITDEYGYFPHPDERMYCIAADDYLRRYFCLDIDTVTDVALRVETPEHIVLAEAAVRDFMAQSEGDQLRVVFEPGSKVLDYHAKDIDRDFILFDILIGLTALLAGLGILNGQLLAALERAKEIGVLKALGVVRGQIAGMVLIESLVVGIVGGVIGTLLGAAMTPVVVDALEELAGLVLPERSAGVWLPGAILGAVLLALIAGLYPVYRMNRFDAVRAVRTG